MKTVVVAGCCRSGTGVTARVLQALGVDMDMDTGHSESATARNINAEFLVMAVGHDFTHHVENWQGVEATDSMAGPVNRIVAFVKEKGTDCWGFKNPKTSLVLSRWLQCLPQPYVVTPFRNPMDVARSLMRYREGTFREVLAFVNFVNQRIAGTMFQYPQVPWLCLNLELMKQKPWAAAKEMARFVGRGHSKVDVASELILNTTRTEERVTVDQ